MLDDLTTAQTVEAEPSRELELNLPDPALNTTLSGYFNAAAGRFRVVLLMLGRFNAAAGRFLAE